MFKSQALALVLALALAPATDLRAQQPQILPDSLLMDIHPDRIGLVGTRSLGGAQKFIVPTVLLYLSADGTVKKISQTVRASATVTGEYQVLGLREAFARELAGYVQSEMAAKFRARGMAVQLYDDVRDNAALTTVRRLTADSNYGAPIVTKNAPRTTFAVLAPSDTQRFAGAELKKHLAFRNLARETGAVVLIPELWFQAPQFARESVGRPDQIGAGMRVSGAMDMVQASITFITPVGATGSITHMVPLIDVSRAVGTLIQTGSDSSHFGNALSAAALVMISEAKMIGVSHAKTPGGHLVNAASYQMMVSEGDYSVGVLRGALSFLTAAIGIIERERRK